MNEEQLVAWAAGLFEGEGCFTIVGGKAKGMTITSTDKDVVDRLKMIFGGSIYVPDKRKSHYKQPYIWIVRSDLAKTFYNKIKPYLLSRRAARGEEWIKLMPVSIPENEKILLMFSEGYTHAEIAKACCLERSGVSKYLNRRGLYREGKRNK